MSELAVRTIPSLLLMLALGAGWWWLRRSQMRSSPGAQLRVVGRVGLLRSATVAVVELEGIRYLIGATEQRVELLSELGEAPIVAEIDDESDTESMSGPWMDLLQRVQTHRSWRPSRGSDRALS